MAQHNATMLRYLAPASLALFLVINACSSSDDATSSSSSGGGGTSGSSGSSCTPNNNDGASSCEGHQEPCPGGQYCSVNICNAGCISTANCPNGMACDFAAATTDNFLNKPVGICRACPSGNSSGGTSSGGTSSGGTSSGGTSSGGTSSGGTSSGSAGTCGDVHGAYTMSVSSSSSQGCGNNKPDECNVAQTDCKITLTCPGFASGQEVTLDGKNKGTFTTTQTVGGFTLTANCTATFDLDASPHTAKLDCTVGSGGASANCIYDGTKK